MKHKLFLLILCLCLIIPIQGLSEIEEPVAEIEEEIVIGEA